MLGALLDEMGCGERCGVSSADRPGDTECEIGVGPETRPCPHWSQHTQLSFDDLGNLVILGTDMLTYGAVIDPETGCYALIHATTFSRYTPVAIHADSMLVYHNQPTEGIHNGKRYTSWLEGSSFKVAMHPRWTQPALSVKGQQVDITALL